MTRTVLPPGLTSAGLVLRVLLFALPCAALALALPDVPHWLVVVLVVACSAWWALTPDHPTGSFALLLVAGWWAVNGVVDWRILVVGVLLVAAHVVATLLSYGPPTLAVDPRLAALWLRRGLMALVPMPVTYVAVRGLDADLAPPWLWSAAALGIVALLVVTARVTRVEAE
jgi:hypothetical protein